MKYSKLTGIAAAAAGLCVCVAGAMSAQPAPTAQPSSQPPSTSGSPSGSADPGWRAEAARFGGVETYTKPSRDVTMRFSNPTEVQEVLVVGGQKVKVGEVMIRARDADIKAALDYQKLRAENELEVRAAEAQLELAKFRYSNLLKADTRDAVSQTELEERRIEQKQAEIQLDQTKFRLNEEKIRLAQAEGQYERFRLEAPFDGTVEEVMVDVGQGVNEQMPVIRVVNTDTLWLDAYPRNSETLELGLKEGSKAWVLIDLPGGARMTEGKVLYLSPVADSVSLSRRVRVAIANGGSWPAGTLVKVRFSEPEGGAGAWPRAAEVASTAASDGVRGGGDGESNR